MKVEVKLSIDILPVLGSVYQRTNACQTMKKCMGRCFHTWLVSLLTVLTDQQGITSWLLHSIAHLLLASCDGVICPVGKTCSLDGEGRPLCDCAACSSAQVQSGPVCTNEGNTFFSECALLTHNCQTGSRESVAASGACEQGETFSLPRNGCATMHFSCMQVHITYSQSIHCRYMYVDFMDIDHRWNFIYIPSLNFTKSVSL